MCLNLQDNLQNDMTAAKNEQERSLDGPAKCTQLARFAVSWVNVIVVAVVFTVVVTVVVVVAFASVFAAKGTIILSLSLKSTK